jgi:hypothetical protein
MTLMKSVLLGLAATLMVVAGAQAADLPTKKGAPAAEYVKVCKIGDVAGFVLPGSDTCLKISGYVNAQLEAGNVKDHWYNQATAAPVLSARQDSFGYYTRGEVDITAVSNTAYGPLLSYIGLRGDIGGGFDSNAAGAAGQQASANGFIVAGAYVQWAGITAGSHPSFYDYLAGGDTWKDFFSPDHSGGGGVPLLAYTATFGGGFAATISLEQPEASPDVYAPSATGYSTVGTNGWDAPDIVAALDLTQSWGGAHLAGVAHQDRYYDNVVGSLTTASPSTDEWGYGVIGGVTFNLPTLGAGSKIAFQGAYAKGAIQYSGAGSPGWGEGDQGFNTNGNGTLFPIADGIYNTTTSRFSQSEAWTLATQATWQLTPTFAIEPMLAYADVKYNSAAAAADFIPQHAYAWWAGAVFDWTAAKNLDFALDLVYESSHQDRVPFGNPASPLTSDGFNGRLHVIRTF